MTDGADTMALLGRLETLTHAQRVREMIALGRRDDAESRALLAKLGRGSFYERYLALHACYGSRDGAHVAEALSDPSRIIRGLAIRLAALACDDAHIATALDTAPADIREALLWRLRGRGRHAPIIAYLERQRTAADRQWPALLGFAPAEAVRPHAAAFQQRADLAAWTALARMHPAIAAEWLRAWTTQPALDTPTLRASLTRLLPLLASPAPDACVALLRAALNRQDGEELADLTLPPVLATRRPQEIADLALAHPNLDVELGRLVARLRPDQITALIAQAPHDLYTLIRRIAELPRDQRLPVFERLRERIVAGRAVTVALLSALPRATREAEARRQLTSPDHILANQLAFAALLPWDEARATLTSYLHAMEIWPRQVALRALIGTVTFDRAHLPDLLALLGERRTERDTIRSAMLAALVELPQSIWREADLPALGEILRHGLNDLGLSEGTQRQMLGLLVKLLPVHPAWATARLEEVLRERGWVQPARDLETLTPAVATQLAEALRPTLEVLLERDQEAALLTFIESLPAQRAVLAPLRPVLEEVIERTRTPDRANRALTLLALAAPSRFAELVPALLLRDRSWITLPAIASYLARARQDLLTSYLGVTLVDGRWIAGRRRFLLPIERPFPRATAGQQARLAEGARAVLADAVSDARAQTQAVRLLARLPAASPDTLIALASDPRTLVRTTALFALARLDTDAGVPALVAALGDARARIAIHAVRPFLRRMPAERALAIVRAIPLERVTVAKEVVRLLAELPWPAAYAELVALGRREDLHRDVRVALLRTLSAHLDRAESWELLEEAARSPDREIALAAMAFGSLAENPDESPITPNQRQHITALLGLLLAHPAGPVRNQALTLCTDPSLRESAHPHFARILELARASTDPQALNGPQALFALAAEEDAPAIGRLIAETLPDRRRLVAMVSSLELTWRKTPRPPQAIVHAALDALAADPLTLHLQVSIAMRLLTAEEVTTYLSGLRGEETLVTAALLGAGDMLRQQAYQFDVPRLERLEAALAASEDARLRLIALAAFQAQVQRGSYLSADRLARLRRFRADAAPLVAASAQFALLNLESDDDDEDE